MKHSLRMAWMFGSICLACPTMTRAGDDHDHADIIVARTLAGQLAIEFDAKMPIALPPASGLITGWAADDPGFMSLMKDEKDEGLFVPSPMSIVVLELISVDPGLKLWRPGFSGVLANPGDQWIIGSPDFDAHAIFHIDANDPAFDPDVSEYFLSFRLLDSGTTGYSASDEITLSFTPVPEPPALVLLAAGALAAARRRNRRGQGFNP